MTLRHSRGISSRTAGFALAALLLGASSGLLGVCGPFSDVAGDTFCAFVVEIFTLGITTGTTPTTYDPTGNVSRLQMAAFLSRTVDGVLKRGSRRAALQKFAVANSPSGIALTTVGDSPRFAACDGADVWVTNNGSSSVSRVRASDGRLLETWTGATGANTVHSDMGRIFVDRDITPGVLYTINPAQPAGVVTTVATNLGAEPDGITFDGGRVWTANKGGSVSIVTPGVTLPWTVTTVTAGFSDLRAALFDGAHVWVTGNVPDTAGLLLKLDSGGAILQTVTVGGSAHYPVFDGANFWVPVQITDAVAVVRAATGAVLQTLTGNGLTSPRAAAFDGERILVVSLNDRVSLWKAADLSPLGFTSTGASTNPLSAASDGVNFWVVLFAPGKLARF